MLRLDRTIFLQDIEAIFMDNHFTLCLKDDPASLPQHWEAQLTGYYHSKVNPIHSPLQTPSIEGFPTPTKVIYLNKFRIIIQ